MTLDDRFFRYLEHFGTTAPVRDLYSRPNERHLVALRHDVDHDLDLALEVAFWERERGCRATFFLLHTAAYWNDARFLDKCLQLQDFGHEVGLHVNMLAEWRRGDVDEPGRRLRDLLGTLRDAGVDVVGISAHGDRLCYEAGFANYWLFAELRPSDPIAEESGRSAEGVRVEDPRYQLAYPPSHRLQRDDNQTLPLWSESFATHNLVYHASHVPMDRYFTDSGGSWTRSPDPLDHDLQRGRHQVLMHPVYYRAPTRTYFFLSTARSGSKWLAHLLDQGTSVTARHEQTLNLRFRDGAFVEEKYTADGFRALPHQPAQVNRLLADARNWVDDHILGDYAETNIYLVHVLDQLTRYFPDACLVHLHRHPYDVVRSLLDRGWYDTPEDDRHPVPDVERWDALTPLEKACHYVRRVNEHMLDRSFPRLRLEEVTRNRHALESNLRALGIATYPRLAAPAWRQILNATTQRSASPNHWDRPSRRILHRICGPVAARLGYFEGIGFRARLRAALADISHKVSRPTSESQRPPARVLFSPDQHPPVRVTGGYIDQNAVNGVRVHRDGKRHTLVFLGAGAWDHLAPTEGFSVEPGTYVTGHLRLDPDDPEPFQAAVFALLFDHDANLLARRRLRNVTYSDVLSHFSFRPPANCARFTIAIYIPLRAGSQRVQIAEISASCEPLPHP